MPGQDVVFVISGRVKDQNGNAVPNHDMKAVFDYWQYVNGVSQEGTQTGTFNSDGNGNYTYDFPGPPPAALIGWDSSEPVVITVSNNEAGWGTLMPGQFGGHLNGTSPIPVPIPDTHLKKTAGRNWLEETKERRKREAVGF